MVCLAYRSLKYYEAQALGALACAFKIEHPEASDQQVKDYTRPYQAVFEQQINDTLPLLIPFNRFWTPLPSAWRARRPSIGINGMSSMAIVTR